MTKDMFEQLEELRTVALSELEAISNNESLGAWKNRYLAKGGALGKFLGAIAQLPQDERAPFGQRTNEIKGELANAHDLKEELMYQQKLMRKIEEDKIDITLPGRIRSVGRLHPFVQVLRQLYSIWTDMGFQVYDSRSIEDGEVHSQSPDTQNYTLTQEACGKLYATKAGVFLQAQGFSGQIQVMNNLGANGSQPVRVIFPGMCYCYEVGRSSVAQFHQIEGLAIGHRTSMSDLKGAITEFSKRLNDGAAVRFRSAYNPYLKPSIEADIASSDDRLNQGTGWLAIAQAGMLDSLVLQQGGYDPEMWSGFAFSMWLNPFIILKRHITDIECLWKNDLRFM